MKKSSFFTLVLLSVSTFISFAVSAQYSLTFRTETYIPLDGAKVLSPTTAWQGFEKGIKLPFRVSMFDYSSDTVVVDEFGVNIYNGNDSTATVFPFGIADYALCDINRKVTAWSGSTVSWLISGDAGNRILKIEYRDVKSERSELQDTINFQMWYYEIDKAFEFHYGKVKVITEGIFAPAVGPIAGVAKVDFDKEEATMAFATGSPIAPKLTMFTTFGAAEFPALNGVMKAGQVYRFGPLIEGVNERDNKAEFYVSPNPSSGKFQISSLKESSMIEVTDLQGRSIRFARSGNEISLAEDLQGVYFIRIYQNEKVQILKVSVE